jgi:hypothetical protein
VCPDDHPGVWVLRRHFRRDDIRSPAIVEVVELDVEVLRQELLTEVHGGVVRPRRGGLACHPSLRNVRDCLLELLRRDLLDQALNGRVRPYHLSGGGAGRGAVLDDGVGTVGRLAEAARVERQEVRVTWKGEPLEDIVGLGVFRGRNVGEIGRVGHVQDGGAVGEDNLQHLVARLDIGTPLGVRYQSRSGGVLRMAPRGAVVEHKVPHALHLPTEGDRARRLGQARQRAVGLDDGEALVMEQHARILVADERCNVLVTRADDGVKLGGGARGGSCEGDERGKQQHQCWVAAQRLCGVPKCPSVCQVSIGGACHNSCSHASSQEPVLPCYSCS